MQPPAPNANQKKNHRYQKKELNQGNPDIESISLKTLQNNLSTYKMETWNRLEKVVKHVEEKSIAALCKLKIDLSHSHLKIKLNPRKDFT